MRTLRLSLSRRFVHAAAALACLVLLVAPAGVTAQDGKLSFPPDSSWQGNVDFSGFLSEDSEGLDGSYYVSVTDVIDDTHISMAFVVGDDGQITSGTMEVELVWFTENAGTSPPNFDPYHIKYAHSQTGTLAISGNADRFVASGTLTHTSDVDSVGDGKIEEVSGTETREVEWTFHITEINCALAHGEILWSSGVSLMNSAWQPREGQGPGHHNALDVGLLAWPAEGDPEDPEALEGLYQAEYRILVTDYPDAQDLLALVDAWNDLNAELARYDECQVELLGLTTTSESSYLIDAIKHALGKALDNPDPYKVWELRRLWKVGLEQAALDEALADRFLDVFDHKLDQAIATDDVDEISDIWSFADAHRYTDLKDKAFEALETLKGGSG